MICPKVGWPCKISDTRSSILNVFAALYKLSFLKVSSNLNSDRISLKGCLQRTNYILNLFIFVAFTQKPSRTCTIETKFQKLIN